MKYLVVFAVVAAMSANAWAQGEQEEITYAVITNVRVFDGTSAQLKNGPVLIANNLIKSIGPGTKVPAGAIEIDGKGGTVIPGLIDMHAHHAIRNVAHRRDPLSIDRRYQSSPSP